MAPVLGLLSILCGLWFVLGMPAIAAVLAWKCRRGRKMHMALIVSLVMLAIFYLSAGLIWRLGTADWSLSFLATLEASVNSVKYGHAAEHRAERMVVWLLTYSTLLAVAAGATAAAGYAKIRRRTVR